VVHRGRSEVVTYEANAKRHFVISSCLTNPFSQHRIKHAGDPPRRASSFLDRRKHFVAWIARPRRQEPELFDLRRISAEVFVLKRDLPKLGFIGAGKVALSLACGLHVKGYTVVSVASRTFSSAQRLSEFIPSCQPCRDKQQVVDSSDVIFITTPDDVIAQVAGELKWQAGKSAVHCSGADSSELLNKAVEDGAAAGVLHPLQTFAGAEQAKNSLAGITFSIEANEPLMAALRSMTKALGGRWMEIKPEDRALYHTSAVMVSNYLVTLVKLSTDLWADFGLSREDAVRALTPLIKGTVDNIETVGLPGCLTGPISRGDTGTLKKHLRALGKNHGDITSAYRELGLKTVPIALEKGRINASKAREIESIFTAPQAGRE
jgi:predicted short-subunit dehydrogenase-like oxidoreductase (DUF2520 family)